MESSCKVDASHQQITPESCNYSGNILRDKHLWFYSVIVAIIAIIAAILISKGMSTPLYISKLRPTWEPSPLIYIAIFTIIYAFITYAWFIADQKSECSRFSRGSINILFALNLFLNILWIYFFFTEVNLSASLFIIIVLLVLTGIMSWYLLELDRLVAYLFMTYFVWLLFISALNLSLYTSV